MGRRTTGASKSAWDEEFDVIVVGSGAAALSSSIAAAVAGARVLVLEKADQLGGTSAWSGGQWWIPNNHHMSGLGLDDSREEALSYIRNVANGRLHSPELVEVFVDTAPHVVKFLEEHSPLKMYVATDDADYYDSPGFKRSGRCLAPSRVNAKEMLGDWWGKVRESPHIPGPLDDEELNDFWSGSAQPVPLHARSRSADDIPPANYQELIHQRMEAGIRFMGPALIAALLKGALDAGVSVRLSTPVERLVVTGGAVAGVVASSPSGLVHIASKGGVVLGTGGFEWDADLALAFLGVPDIFPLSPTTNVGDGLRMGLEVGAAVANMTAAVTFPAFWDGRELDGKPLGRYCTSRNDPGALIVNGFGRRFVNEGICYADMPRVFRAYDPFTHSYPNTTPVWVVLDDDARRRTIDIELGPTPDWVVEAASIEELAERIDVNPAVLSEEVARWNRSVEDGKDSDFHRGEIWWEGYTQGGPSPQKNMRRVATAPFYAHRLFNGVGGTWGGLRIDANARVRAARGGVIEGLYAAGLVSANVFGEAYPGPGSTLGPGATFGYLAGRHAALRAKSLRNEQSGIYPARATQQLP